jgi:PAS domain S-box-containing protein/putative nucleotidyltransferase with HDIG domain
MEILLLEDNPGDVRYIDELLKSEDTFQFTLTSLDHLQKGISWLIYEKPDVILLDLGLPDSQGLDTLIKVALHVPYIPIIVLTGLNDKEVAIKALKANAQDYLIKGGFDKDLLIRVINYSIERKQHENNLAVSEERLRLALKSSKQGLFDFDIKTGIVIVNEFYALMLGYDPENFSETFDQMLKRTHPDDVALIKETFQNYFDGEIADHKVEFRMQTLNGDWVWIQSFGNLIEKDNGRNSLRIIGTHTNITESKTYNQKIAELLSESERRLQRIETFHKIDSAISTIDQMETTLAILLEQLKIQLQVDAADILLFDESEGVFFHAENIGFGSRKIANSKVKLGESLAGKVLQDNEIIIVHNIEDKEIDPVFKDLLVEERIKDYFGISLVAKNKFIGVLEIFFRTPFNPDEEWYSYLRIFAGLAAIAIENGQLILELQKANTDLVGAYDETIVGWSNALDLRDKETEGHSKRVTDTTIALAKMFGFKKEELLYIQRGALLHDIGKMGVPDAILLKPGKLTDEERVIMQKHPTVAYELLKPISFLSKSLDIPLYHHEKWDGTGYPYGLRDNQIPLSARLFAIVDVYDALISDRPYRQAWSKEGVIEYIKSQKGIHFDPEIVPRFLYYIMHT